MAIRDNIRKKKVIVSGGGSSGGGSSGGVGIVPNGYVVHFHNYDHELIESHSAKMNNWIDKPISFVPVNWENSQGYIYSFPLKVEEGMENVIYLYPTDDDLEESFYAQWNLRNDYPYFIIEVYDNGSSHNVKVTVIQTYTLSGNSQIITGLCSSTNPYTIGEYIPIGDKRRAVTEALENCTWGNPGSSSSIIYLSNDENRFYCANFEFAGTTANWYVV